ncbi:uncharacterized protein LOC144110628 isoform X1 [Amblyomma americanum]
MDLAKTLELALKLGLSEKEAMRLCDEEKEEAKRQIEERAQARADTHDAEEREAKRAREAEECEAKRAREAEEREVKRAREAEEREARRAREAEEQEKRRIEWEKEFILWKQAHVAGRYEEITDNDQRSLAGTESPRPARVCPRKLMAPFYDKRDDLDAYLQRFERIALGQGWERSEWATALSMCLVGEALNVFGRMPAADSMDYEKVKKALLQRFRLTAEGFRERFCTAKLEDSETAKQFSCRLSNYFDRWLDMSNTEKSFEGVRDKLVTEQFLACCSSKLALFLKERKLCSLEEFADTADQFLEAQGLRNLNKAKEETQKVLETDARWDTVKVARLCGKVGHRAAGCRTSSAAQKTQVVCQGCKRRGHTLDECRYRTQDRAACVVDSRVELVTPPEVPQLKGEQTPLENEAVSGTPKSKAAMPLVVGQIGDHPILVLRDSGANTVLVRRSLVKDEDLTGKASAVTLVDSTVRYLPEARILVSTPYYTGQVVAKCVDQPIYNLILGNITGARGVEDPDPEWRMLDGEEHPKEERPVTAQTGAVSFSSAVRQELKRQPEQRSIRSLLLLRCA